VRKLKLAGHYVNDKPRKRKGLGEGLSELLLLLDSLTQASTTIIMKASHLQMSTWMFLTLGNCQTGI
jgi:hypothetical protein